MYPEPDGTLLSESLQKNREEASNNSRKLVTTR